MPYVQRGGDFTLRPPALSRRCWECKGEHFSVRNQKETNSVLLWRNHDLPWSFVIRLSLGKLLVNLSQVVERTNTPLTP